MLNDEEILDVYNENVPKLEGGLPTREPEFTLEDLIGETFLDIRDIYRGRNENPDYLKVVDFKSGRALIVGIEGWDDRETHHSFLVEPNRSVRYTGELFSEYK